jgi:hypothetical protein
MCFLDTLTEIAEFAVESDEEITKCAYGEHETSGKETAVSYFNVPPLTSAKDIEKTSSGIVDFFNSIQARCHFVCRESSRSVDYKKAAD